MKRVLHVVGAMQRAGAETLLMNLYRNLDRSQFQFDFLYFTDKECDYDNEIKNLGGEIYRIESTKKNKLLRVGYRYFNYYRLLKSLPDHQIVHSHINLNGAIFILIAKYLKREIRISHSHIATGKNAFIPNLYRYITRKIIKHNANRYLACGRAAGKYLYPNVTESDIVVFPNSIDIGLFQSFYSESNYLRDKLNLASDVKIVVQIGRFTLQKNFEFTINFAHHLIKEDPLFHFVFLGAGPMENELKKMVKDNNLDKYITFYGVSKEIPKILHSADVFFMPSRLEGFPVVLVEAQACGVPCLISTNISSEVDMELNLVGFANLNDDLSVWKHKLYNSLSKKSNDFETIKKVMRSKNFDSKESVKKLEELYLK